MSIPTFKMCRTVDNGLITGVGQVGESAGQRLIACRSELRQNGSVIAAKAVVILDDAHSRDPPVVGVHHVVDR